jgi:hypothetical protein
MKFFNKFRQKLLTENKFSKYLIYAIGEIILVVIGILIAIGVNNKNQYKKHRNLEITILDKFTKDLEQDSIALSNLMHREKFMDKEIDTILILLNLENESNISKILDKLGPIGASNIFYPNTGTYDEAISSSLISNILNDSIRSEIFNYYRLVNNNKIDILTDTYQKNEIVPTLSNIIFESRQATKIVTSFDNPNLKVLTLKDLNKDPKFYKILNFKKVNSYYLIENWNVIKSKSTKLKHDILNQLKNRIE